jgi:hypothetical protein
MLGSLYVDQPVGAGFSHGTMEVGTSQQAATDMYTVRVASSNFLGPRADMYLVPSNLLLRLAFQEIRSELLRSLDRIVSIRQDIRVDEVDTKAGMVVIMDQSSPPTSWTRTRRSPTEQRQARRSTSSISASAMVLL